MSKLRTQTVNTNETIVKLNEYMEEQNFSKYHADRIIDVSVLPDYVHDTTCNSVWINYIEGGVPQKTNAPNLCLDRDTRERIKKLLLSAAETINLDYEF